MNRFRPSSDVYGYQISGYSITLCNPAFTGGKCRHNIWAGLLFGLPGWWASAQAPTQQPGLPLVILHEFLHSCGHKDERDVRRIGEKCFPHNLPL